MNQNDINITSTRQATPPLHVAWRRTAAVVLPSPVLESNSHDMILDIMIDRHKNKNSGGGIAQTGWGQVVALSLTSTALSRFLKFTTDITSGLSQQGSLNKRKI